MMAMPETMVAPGDWLRHQHPRLVSDFKVLTAPWLNDRTATRDYQVVRAIARVPAWV